MSCGMPHLDIFKDTTEENFSGDSLELDRIKDKIRAIWSKVIVAEYNEQYSTQKEDSEDYVSLEDYIKENKISFPGDDKPEDEMSEIAEMLESLFDPQEELEPINSEGKAPTYSGSTLKSNNEKGSIEATSYEVKHSSTSTPSDSKSSVKSSTYTTPTTGKISPRKDSQVKRSHLPLIKKIVEELLDLESRQGIGRRRELFRL